jgi:UDP-N-acetylmuramyl pentapeptide synthase
VWPAHSAWHADHWQLQLHTPLGLLTTEMHIAGRHNLRNAMAAATTALAAGAPLAAVAQGLREFRPVAGRSRTHALPWQGHTGTLIDDTYNANPDSVLAAIDVLASLPAPRLLVLGDMGEVGVHGAAFHAEVGQHAQAQGIERLFTLGALAQASAAAHAHATHFDDMAALQAAVLAQAAQGGSVLVKGSRFMRMERVVQALLDHVNAQEATCS